MSTAPSLFVPLQVQFENIGDIMLRRQLAGWLRSVPGPVDALVGDAPADFVDGLELPASARIHRSFRAWSAQLVRAPRGSSYIYKPGEILATTKGMREHVGLLPLIANLKRRGGAVLRVGSGLRQVDPAFVRMMKPSARLAGRVHWRDAETRDAFGVGEVMPDLAFAEGSDAEVFDNGDPRPYLAVSFRGDRPPLPDAYLRAVRAAAERNDLRIVVVAQVTFDRERSKQLAGRLGGELAEWGPTTDIEHERAVRAVYRGSEFALSDRLHVLIAAATEGAWPVGLVPSGDRKLARHFDAAGLTGVAAPFDPARPEQLGDLVAVGRKRRERLGDLIAAARARVDDVRAEAILDLRSAHA